MRDYLVLLNTPKSPNFAVPRTGGDFKSFVPPRGGLGGRNHTHNQQHQKFTGV
ncbi:hypothetical protein LYNGBM3L_59270 [Moorena producens 3L]|uniref:Uncharacterized protein n=1 Tax=Moorena producens 3L TaxID=489825 RepID=F4XZZ5_9CYAN|nr:hypothetical protein LYNGBM3L_59270 [Moorena producens 3L]